MSKKKVDGGQKFIVGSLFMFLFSNFLLFVYGTIKTLSKKRKK